MPSSVSSTQDVGTDEGTSEIHNVLLYKKHSKFEVPTTGTLLLSTKTLSFRGHQKYHYWNLDSIGIEKFKGRTSHGMKILGRSCAGGRSNNASRGEDQKEYIFTKVTDESYEKLRSAIEAAKLDKVEHRHLFETKQESESPSLGEDESEADSGASAAESGDDNDMVTPFQDVNLKNVLYYKDRHKSSMPVRGTLRLGPSTISFHSQVHAYCWSLSSIAVERFQGRMTHGMKIIGERMITEDDEAMMEWMEDKEQEEEYTFTHVDQMSVYAIQGAVKEAKFAKEAEDREDEGDEEGLTSCCWRAWLRLQATAASILPVQAAEQRKAERSRRKVHALEELDEPLVHRK